MARGPQSSTPTVVGDVELPSAKETEFNEQLSDAYVRRSSALRSIACRAGRDEADDVVQDAFLRIVETSKREEIQKVDNLLSRIVRCVAIDRVRRRNVRGVTVSLGPEERVMDLAVDPERSLMVSQRLQRVADVIKVMPPKRREVFLLHRVEEMTYPQIARKLGVSIKAVEKHIHLAMRQLSDADD